MNITVQVDEVTLGTVVAEVMAYDEEGGSYAAGERTIADLVAEQIMTRLLKAPGWPSLASKVQEIRIEEIRAAIRPQIEEAIARPLRKTNSYGEPAGAETTLREIIVDEARKAVNEPADRYSREKGTFLTQAVAAEVKKAFAAEIAAAVRQAREQVSAEIGQHVAAAVQEGLRKR